MCTSSFLSKFIHIWNRRDFMIYFCSCQYSLSLIRIFLIQTQLYFGFVIVYNLNQDLYKWGTSFIYIVVSDLWICLDSCVAPVINGSWRIACDSILVTFSYYLTSISRVRILSIRRWALNNLRCIGQRCDSWDSGTQVIRRKCILDKCLMDDGESVWSQSRARSHLRRCLQTRTTKMLLFTRRKSRSPIRLPLNSRAVFRIENGVDDHNTPIIFFALFLASDTSTC